MLLARIRLTSCHQTKAAHMVRMAKINTWKMLKITKMSGF